MSEVVHCGWGPDTHCAIAYSGILKLKFGEDRARRLLDSSVVDALPEEAVLLPPDKIHITLVHQSILKPYRDLFKRWTLDGTMSSRFPAILGYPRDRLTGDVSERVDDALGRKSWVVGCRDQYMLKEWVLDLMVILGLPREDPEPQREFHVTIANLTGSPFDSVR